MKKSIVALLALMSSAASVFAPPFEIAKPIETGPIYQPMPSLSALPSYSAAPSFSVAPSLSVAPSIPQSARARAADAPLRGAVAEVFAYQRATLTETTRVTDWDDGTYSVRATFTVRGESVAVRCVSTVRAAVVAFLDYIKRIFGAEGSTADWSLEDIVAGGRSDIARRAGLSDAEITVTLIDQFNQTHVVQVSRHELEVMLASK